MQTGVDLVHFGWEGALLAVLVMSVRFYRSVTVLWLLGGRAAARRGRPLLPRLSAGGVHE